LASGVIGKVKMAKALNLQRHRPRPPVPDAPAPPGVDYDLWLGPAAKRAFNRNRFHGYWNWYRDCGNGSIMRLAPVVVRYASLFPDRLEELVGKARDSSLPTHASPQCLSACAYLGLVLCGLIHGMDRDEVLAPNWRPLLQLKELRALHPEVAEVAAGSFRQRQPPEIVGSGYVAKSLEAALWAFHDAKDCREAVLRAANLGDDADTTGAVCGQLAGAYWGESGIPAEWLAGLARRDMIEQASCGLLGDSR